MTSFCSYFAAAAAGTSAASNGNGIFILISTTVARTLIIQSHLVHLSAVVVLLWLLRGCHDAKMDFSDSPSGCGTKADFSESEADIGKRQGAVGNLARDFSGNLMRYVLKECNME